MKLLICQAGGFAHNTKGKCNARTIEVRNTSDQTFCNTYVHEDKYLDDQYPKSLLNNLFNVEFGEDSYASPKILCNVTECAYNKSFKCKASGVEIDNPHAGDVCNCMTYRQK